MPHLINSLIIASICLFGGPAFSVELDLNEKEKAWLNSHSEIRLGAITGWPPYNFYDSNGAFTGISSEIIKRIEINTGLKFKYIKGDWDDLRLQIKERKVDVLSAVYYTPERARYMLFTRPYSELHDYIFTRKDRNDIKDIESIRRIAIVKGFSQGEIIKDKHPDIEITWYDSMLLALKGVIAGHADAYIGSIASVSYLISSKQLIELKVAAPAGWVPANVSMAVSTEHPELLGILNKAINTIEERDINKINRQWFALEHEAFINYKLLWISIVIGLVLFTITSIWLFSLRLEVKLRKKAEEYSRQREHKLSIILDTMIDSVFSIDNKGNILSVNNAAVDMFGYDKEHLLNSNIKEIMPAEHAEKHDKYLSKYVSTGHSKIMGIGRELFAVRSNGETFPIRVSVSELPKKEGQTAVFIGVCQDISEKTLQDDQLRRTLKMDALGKMTGGIAHDYNNMMGIVLGYSELLLSQVVDNEKAFAYVMNIRTAGERARDLTLKLMTFSRNKPTSKTFVNLNKELNNQKDLLEKTLTSRIQLNIDLEDDLWPVYLDSGDFNDAIINMTINASHAIETNGTVSISANNIHLDKYKAEQLELTEGDYVKVSFSDSGKGMDPDTLSKVFDPFFSTKGDQGTGLGLSQVYGFVIRSNGSIKVNSELNLGTEFTAYFPRHVYSNLEQDTLESTNKNTPERVHETILVVDDEKALCNLAIEILTNYGYHVLCAFNGVQALEILKTEHVDIVFSDVIMPEMTGYELAAKISDKYPNIHIKLTSGYAGKEKSEYFDDLSSFNILDKPYTNTELLNEMAAFSDKK